MLRSLCLFALALSACVPVEPPLDREDAHRLPAEAEPVPLPQPTPSTRLQSDLSKASPADIARWALPAAEARAIAAAELLTGFTPRANAIALYEQPRSADYAGLCEVRGYEVWLRVPNENSLTYEQHLDPPLQPYQYRPITRWKVTGSTLGGESACAAERPNRDWIPAPSAEVLHRALSFVERAQRGLLRPRLHCRQLRMEEGPGFATPACPDARAVLARLTPDLVRRVRTEECEGAAGARGLAIEYHDPAAPGTHSLYVVSLPEAAPAGSLRITQAMLPPS